MGDVKKFVSLEKLNLNNEYVKKYVGTKNAGNFKAAKFDSATKTLKLYKKADPSDEDTADFELVIPDPDVSSLMGKVTTATADNIAVFDENGNVKDSGKTLVNVETRLTALEGKVGDGFAEITEDEIKQLWEEA